MDQQRLSRGILLIGFLTGVALLAGCMKLDPFLFSEEKTTSYMLDAYTGKRECSDAIDSLGPLADSVIHQINLTSGNNAIASLFLHNDTICDTSDTLILYFHGKSDNNDYYWPRIRLLYATGYPVFAIDYRGFGKSTGTPTEEGINEDGLSALNYIYLYLGNPKVLVYAFSLGSLVGCELASTDNQHRISKLILEAPIGSVETMVEDGSYLNLPGSYLTTFTGDNTERIKRVTIPLLWLHGTKDETLNRETNGLPIWNNYTGEKGCYHAAEGAGHTTIPQTIGYNDYISCVRDFIRNRGNTLLTCKP
jgi:pimeloyl-ACP methyl ester carboxylesterase